MYYYIYRNAAHGVPPCVSMNFFKILKRYIIFGKEWNFTMQPKVAHITRYHFNAKSTKTALLLKVGCNSIRYSI
jgi:hypothetical protein